MSNGHRWSKFWWQDHQRDGALRACSLAARGYWVEMLCIMHEAVPPGYLLINGRPVTHRQMAALAACSEREARKYEAELEEARVFSRTESGAIYCRRMVRDAGVSEAGAEEVRRRWGSSKEDHQTTRSSRLAAARLKGVHTPYEWDAMLHITGHHCLKCGSGAGERGGLVKDHVIPIYQGGSDAIDNIQPMCARCNSAKGPDTTDHRPTDWSLRLTKRLGDLGIKRLGNGADPSSQTSSLEAESEAEERTPPRPPPSKGGRSRAEKPRFKAGIFQLIADEGSSTTDNVTPIDRFVALANAGRRVAN